MEWRAKFSGSQDEEPATETITYCETNLGQNRSFSLTFLISEYSKSGLNTDNFDTDRQQSTYWFESGCRHLEISINQMFPEEIGRLRKFRGTNLGQISNAFFIVIDLTHHFAIGFF